MMDLQHRNTPPSATARTNASRDPASCAPVPAAKLSSMSVSQSREIITPTITELTKEARTNILCTVKRCGKILPNTPALNMHLVKSHRIKDGMVNPTVRKDMKGSQKLYCCPVEGCPRGAARPFSQFSLVKQHYMKMHTEKKHKCSKCNNGYSTEWDLRRHMEDCGKIYQCSCGCPYASRPALLSHIYRTGHELPTEHRIPPVKKRKMEKLLSDSEKVKTSELDASNTIKLAETAPPSNMNVHIPHPVSQASNRQKSFQKLLLPKPKMALVSVPVMQLAHLPVLLPSTESGALRSVVLAVDSQGSVSTLHLLPQATGAAIPQLDNKSLIFKDSMPTSRSSLGPISTGIQVSLDSVEDSPAGQRGRSTSTNIQTDKSYLSKMPGGICVGEGMGFGSAGESSVSSWSQTDISVSAQVLLPVSVETQTFSCLAKDTSSIGAQTDSGCPSQIPCSFSSSVPPYKTRQTQTRFTVPQPEEKAHDQGILCTDLFSGDSLSVSTQTALDMHDSLFAAGSGLYDDSKSASGMCFGVQTDELNSNNMADNQTQTMTLLNDLENILSDSMSGHQVLTEASAACGSGLGSVQEQHNNIDFDFEEFLNAVHIQTQTEESELGGLGGETPLESLDIQTQTDFLLMDELDQSEGPNRGQASDLELFDTHTQTDLNFLLNAGSQMPLSSILRHSSFSISTESSDTETQTDLPPFAAGLSAQAAIGQGESARLLNSAETQTVNDQAEGHLGHLFLTSNETQTVLDDFLSADLAWNMVSHFSSVETQTCGELCALFQNPEKPNS